jgi:FkbM family methyltransferase
MREFESILKLREELMDGEGPWMWVLSDTGAWDGPKKDWEHSHKIKYMQYLKHNKAVVTAGANLGLYAKKYASMFEVVWAFEPDYLNFHCLVNNCQNENVIKIQAILGSQNGVAGISQEHMNNVGMHRVNEQTGFIPVLTIDSLNLPYCSLIQLDVEGYELHALCGAVETIRKHRPVIAAENGSGPEIDKLLSDMNYKNQDQSVSDTIWVPKEYL